MDKHQQFFYISLSSYTDHEQIPPCMDLFQRLFHTFLGSWGDQGHIPKTMGLQLWLCYTFLASYTDQEHTAMSTSFTSTAFSHIFWVLYLSAINFNNTGSFSVVCINISLFTRNNLRLWLLKNSSLFIHILQSSASIGIWTSESTDCKQPLLVPETFIKFYTSILETKFWGKAVFGVCLFNHFHSPNFQNSVHG